MTTRLMHCVVLLAFAGCSAPRKHEDAFEGLHYRTTKLLGNRCNVAPVSNHDAQCTRFFEVGTKLHDSGCRVLVYEREFFTQGEWQKRYVAGTKQLTKFLTTTNQLPDVEGTNIIASLESLSRLPEWHYKNIGVDATVQCPEVVYPNMARDSSEAVGFLHEIVSLLKPYRRDSDQLGNQKGRK